MRLVLLLLMLGSLAVIQGCGAGGGDGPGFGDAGVSNGGIIGSVRGVASLGTIPVSGAYVTARRLTGPTILRTTRSDANGEFVFSDLPVGPYTLSVSAPGFLSVDEILDVHVESGTFAHSPPIHLDATLPLGPANLVVTVLDGTSGDPIEDATVTAGVAAASFGPGGVYRLSVPISLDATLPPVVPLTVQLAGYDESSLDPRTVLVAPGEVTAVTVRLTPLRATISGRVRIAAFEGAYLQAGALSTVSVKIANVSPDFTQGVVDPATGEFRLLVPVSTPFRPRSLTLTFVSPLFEIAIVPGIVAPVAGNRTLAGEITLIPIGFPVGGSVFTSSGTFPGSHPVDSATLLELGSTVPIVNGSYTFGAVPVGLPLTLDIAAFNPLVGRVETARLTIRPVINPGGRFVVPTVTTR